MQLKKSDFNLFAGDYSDFAKRGFRPRKDVKPVRLKLPLDWDTDPLNDRNWRFQLHGWRMLPPIWKEFYGQAPAHVSGKVLPWVRDWYDYHVRQKMTSDFMWYDMAAGLRAQHLALILHMYRSGEFLLETHELLEVEELAAMHISKLRDPAFISKGNHGIFQLVGLRLLGIVWANRPETEGEEAYSCRLMGELLDSQFGPQGVHVENSPDYHALALAQFARIRPELFPGIAEQFRQKLVAAREVASWLTMPSGAHAAIGDSEKDGCVLTEPFRCDDQSMTDRGDRIVLRDLTEGGYAVVRSAPEVPQRRASMLIVKGQAFTRSHAHADQLGFELFAFGRSLLVDSGKFGYDRDSWRHYFTSDRAHNVVGLQGVDFDAADTRLGTSGLSQARLVDDSRYFIEGAITRGEYFTHRRTFEYLPGRTLIIADEIDAGDTDVPVVYFHLAAGLRAEFCNGVVTISSSGTMLATLVMAPSVFSAEIICGREKPSIQGWLSLSYGSRIPANVIELRGPPGLRKWRAELALIEPVDYACGVRLPDFPSGVVPGFPYTFVAERVVNLSDGRMQKRVLVEYLEGTVEVIDRALEQDLQVQGFRRRISRPEQGGLRSFYGNHELALTTLVRPATSKAVRCPGAKGSVYFAFTYPNALVASASASVEENGGAGEAGL